MGREIRRVPANWEHPKYTAENAHNARHIGQYRPLFDDYAQYGDGLREWYQVYETVSEGTPVSPPFATQDELIEYLCTHGDFWSQQRGEGAWPRTNAERFVRDVQWVPSGICTPERGFQTGVEALGNP